jgi:hypothetical protein
MMTRQQSRAPIWDLHFCHFMQLGFNLKNRVTDTLDISIYTQLVCLIKLNEINTECCN